MHQGRGLVAANHLSIAGSWPIRGCPRRHAIGWRAKDLIQYGFHGFCGRTLGRRCRLWRDGDFGFARALFSGLHRHPRRQNHQKECKGGRPGRIPSGQTGAMPVPYEIRSPPLRTPVTSRNANSSRRETLGFVKDLGRLNRGCSAALTRSTNELGARAIPSSQAPDSGGAITITNARMVQLVGLEPTTFGSTIRRSNQLSYSCTLAEGAGKTCKSRIRQKQGRVLQIRTGCEKQP